MQSMTDTTIDGCGKAGAGRIEVGRKAGSRELPTFSVVVDRIGSAYRTAIRDALEATDAAVPVTAAMTASPGALPQKSTSSLASLSRAVVLQAVGAAGIAGLWIAGVADKPFEGENAILCWLIVGMAALGILCVFLRRWSDVQWIATHVVRIGLLGTVVGLIIAFSAAKTG